MSSNQAIYLNPLCGAWNFNGPAIEILEDAVTLLKANQEYAVAKAMDLFSSVQKEVRNEVYGVLFHQIPFTNAYWGCAEDAFHDRNGLRTTPEQKSQAIIECALSQMIAAAKLQSNEQSVNPRAVHFLLRKAAELFNSGDEESLQKAMGLFARMPKDLRESVYGELYLLINFKHDYWGCAEDAFFDRNNQHSSPRLKALAIHIFLFRNIADLLKRGEENIAENLFKRMPREQQEGIWVECYHLLHDKPRPSSTLELRAQTIQNYLLRVQKMEREGPVEKKQEPAASVKLVNPVSTPTPKIPIAQPLPPTPVIPAEKLKATEPKLSNEEVRFERCDAETIFSVGDRSITSSNFIRDLSNYKYTGLEINGEIYMPVTGGTQNFSTSKLASCGSSLNREILVLNSTQSPELAMHYTQFRKLLHSGMTTFDVLHVLKDYVRKQIFPSCLLQNMSLVDAVILPSISLDGDLESTVSRMVDQARKTHLTVTNTKNPSTLIPIMPLDDFVKSQIGLCRHHALTTAYLIDRLLSEKDPLIEGTVQHIRGNLDGPFNGAHSWDTLIPKQKGKASPEKWHLDTFWDELFNFAEDQTKLRWLYGNKMAEDQMHRTKVASKKNGQPE